MKKTLPLLAAIVILAALSLVGPGCRKKAVNPVDLEGLRSSGDDWELIREDIRPDGGHLRYNHDKWLMYFLHWRPLTEAKKNISVDYVRQQMLSFWGPNMPFTITSEGGETTVSGHKAFFIDGTIYQGTIRTRFIIWNCEETNRQFIADCNINVGAGTPPGLLELQGETTHTISCHGQPATRTNPVLSRPYESKPFSLSFFIPENWRTLVYSDPAWFPDGPTERSGTLWTLPTDSNKSIDLFWKAGRQRTGENLFREFLGQLEQTRYELNNIRYELKGVEAKNIAAKKGYFAGEGVYELQAAVKVGNQERTVKDPYVFRAFLWTKGGRTYFLTVSLISRQAFWGRPADLAPPPEVFDRYVREEVLPRVPVFNRILD